MQSESNKLNHNPQACKCVQFKPLNSLNPKPLQLAVLQDAVVAVNVVVSPAFRSLGKVLSIRLHGDLLIPLLVLTSPSVLS